MFKKTQLKNYWRFLVFSSLIFIMIIIPGGVSEEPEEQTKPKGFIGYGGGFDWQFDIEQEDNDIYTEVEVINETVLEITVKAKYDLSEGYKWDMAICNIEGFDSLQYMEEDAQGGFENSYAEDLNHIKLEYEGLNSSWCEETNGYGFVLFSSGSKQQLPEHFRIIFEEGEKEFKMFTGSGSEVVVGSGGYSTYAYIENMVRDSNGRLHLLWVDSGADIQYSYSDNNGSSWTTTTDVFGAGTQYDYSLLINSTGGLFAIWLNKVHPDYEIYYSESSDYGSSWQSPQVILDGNATHQWAHSSATMDDNDNIHVCAVTLEWQDITTNDWLAYTNYSSSTKNWLGVSEEDFVWVNTNSADDTDFCDIETDSNGVVYIVGVGTDDDSIDIWLSTDWSSKTEIHQSNSDNKPAIFIDSNDKIVVAWEQDTNDLGFANSTPTSATTSWDLTAVDSDSSDNPSIKITNDGDIYILYEDATASNRDILKSYWISSTDSWTVREIVKDNVWDISPMPITRGSRIGNNLIEDRIDYVFWNETDGNLYFDFIDISAPPDTCTSGLTDGQFDCGDNCVITTDMNIPTTTLNLYGSGTFTVLADIVAGKVQKVNTCQIINKANDGKELIVKL